VTIEVWHGRPANWRQCARLPSTYCPKQRVETGISKGKEASRRTQKRQNEKRETGWIAGLQADGRLERWKHRNVGCKFDEGA
jgi:hypothetical protein